jgi:hypothetical protein
MAEREESGISPRNPGKLTRSRRGGGEHAPDQRNCEEVTLAPRREAEIAGPRRGPASRAAGAGSSGCQHVPPRSGWSWARSGGWAVGRGGNPRRRAANLAAVQGFGRLRAAIGILGRGWEGAERGRKGQAGFWLGFNPVSWSCFKSGFGFPGWSLPERTVEGGSGLY